MGDLLPRGFRFSHKDKTLLAKLVNSFPAILYKGLDAESLSKKLLAWEDLTRHFNASSTNVHEFTFTPRHLKVFSYFSIMEKNEAPIQKSSCCPRHQWKQIGLCIAPSRNIKITGNTHRRKRYKPQHGRPPIALCHPRRSPFPRCSPRELPGLHILPFVHNADGGRGTHPYVVPIQGLPTLT